MADKSKNLNEYLRLGLFLFVISAVAAGLLAGVYLVTAPKISAQKAQETRQALTQLLPAAQTFNQLTTSTWSGSKEGSEIGRIYLEKPMGYSGPIEILVAIESRMRVAGVKILSMAETPGLGTKVLSPQFLQQFIGKSGKDPINPKEDIDAITGATITSRAVCKGVKSALEKYSSKQP
ncbi:MAG: RnfABCDGE type electron transport complex subunit G [Candidatus Margulisiibacteriota bacterium]